MEGTTTTYYFFANYEVEVTGGQQIAQRRITLATSEDQLLYIHKDHLGSAVRLTDTGGNVVQSLAYDPFGATVYSVGVNAPSNQYTGQKKDDTGLYYYGARYYSPEIGRFISPDTILAGLNRYAYCHNNPINYTDPTGHTPNSMEEAISETNAARKRARTSGGGSSGSQSGPSNQNYSFGSDEKGSYVDFSFEGVRYRCYSDDIIEDAPMTGDPRSGAKVNTPPKPSKRPEHEGPSAPGSSSTDAIKQLNNLRNTTTSNPNRSPYNTEMFLWPFPGHREFNEHQDKQKPEGDVMPPIIARATKTTRMIGANLFIIAPADGVVTRETHETTDKQAKDWCCGNSLTIKFDNGWRFYTGHHFENRVHMVNGKGDRVKAGQVIAIMGSTGHSGTEHSHTVFIDPKGNPRPLDKVFPNIKVGGR